jgi:hypothetical protein
MRFRGMSTPCLLTIRHEPRHPAVAGIESLLDQCDSDGLRGPAGAIPMAVRVRVPGS